MHCQCRLVGIYSVHFIEQSQLAGVKGPLTSKHVLLFTQQSESILQSKLKQFMQLVAGHMLGAVAGDW